MKKDNCVFCKLANGEIPTNTLYEDALVKVIFDAAPTTKGHLLILTKTHFDNIYTMDDETASHVFKTAVKISKAIKHTLHCDGINILQNNEEVAGQTVFHFHMHIIPRYIEDKFNIIFNHGELKKEDMEEIKEKVQKEL